MDRYEFYVTIVEALAHNSDLADWSTTYFGAACEVYAGLDNDDLPDDKSSAPRIVLAYPGKVASQENRDVTWRLAVWLIIDAAAAKIRAEDRLHELIGVELIFDMITKVQAVVIAALPANWFLAVEDEVDLIGMRPEIHGYMELTFTEHITIGTDPML